MGFYAEVIISISSPEVDKRFHYSIPDDIAHKVIPGMRVLVPFGPGGRGLEGYVVGLTEEVALESSKIKSITSVLDDSPVFSIKMLELARWMREKYYSTLSSCLKCVMPPGIALKNGVSKSYKKIVKYVKANFEADNFEAEASLIAAKGGAQAAALDFIIKSGGVTLNRLLVELKISMSPVSTLLKKGLIFVESIEERRNVTGAALAAGLMPPIELTAEQSCALERLETAFAGSERKPFLLHGVTGSGKTEIYMRLIQTALDAGKQAVMLVPEISLTPQAVEVFTNRFGERVTVTHSRLSTGERLDQWKKARDGQVSVIIGPRSAIFTPFDSLGVIIIDEEHENTYKSETSPKYCVNEVAAKLSELTGCLVVMGSATPSVETYYRAETGEAELLKLTQRVNNRPPDVYIADMRLELANGNRGIFSKALYEAIAENVENKRQTILFMNRRGHSTFVSCRSCGYVMECGMCNVNYTYHIYNNSLMCHYCGKTEQAPETCPVCGSVHIRYFGAGTQKIEEEIGRCFPGAVAIRMDMDTTGRKNSHGQIIKQFATGEADILIGTQMIAKGLNFPNVSLVGIIAADTALNSGDFRSAETAFQLITQVSGRAGRAELPGRVFIQTYNPAHYSIIFAKNNDYESFYDHEIRLRRQMRYPPFSNIFMALLTGEDEKKIIVTLNKLSVIMNHYNRKGFFEMLGPAPAMVSKINGAYRWKILVKGDDEALIKQFVFYCVDRLRKSENTDGITFNLTLNPRVLA